MNISRRDLFKRFAVGGALLAGTAVFMSGCGGVRRRRSHEAMPEIGNEISEILYHASLAPSGHNTQPWEIRLLGDKTMVIGIDPKRTLPVVDPHNRETLLSIGAFIENLHLAAGTLGYESTVHVLAQKSSDREIAKIVLKKSQTGNYPLERITARRTVRNGFRSDELQSRDVEALSKPLRGRLFYFPRSSEHARCIGEGTLEAFTHQTNRDEAQQELAHWIRFGNSEAKRNLDGLTTESMEMSGFVGWYVRNFMNRDDVVKKSFRKKSIEQVARQVRGGGGWLVITGNGEGVSDIIETGRRFERMFLLARERNIAIHPMTQMIEEKKWRDDIGARHDARMVPQFILRVGYRDNYPDPVSLRRPVQSFIHV